MPTYVQLRTTSLGIHGRPATHNPLVHGSSPCGPTKQESRALRGFFVSGRFYRSTGKALDRYRLLRLISFT